MKVLFHINYRTAWGESLYIIGSGDALGDFRRDKAVKMTLVAGETWEAEVFTDDTAELNYRYLVVHESGAVKEEWGPDHKLELPTDLARCDIFDRWQDMPADKPYYASAFTDCICRHESKGLLAPQRGKVLISISAPMVAPNQVVAKRAVS